jgi:hypothetical protein
VGCHKTQQSPGNEVAETTRVLAEEGGHSQIRTAGIEVEMHGIGSDRDGTQVGRIVLITGNGRIGASVGSSLDRSTGVCCGDQAFWDSLAVLAQRLDYLGRTWTMSQHMYQRQTQDGLAHHSCDRYRVPPVRRRRHLASALA